MINGLDLFSGVGGLTLALGPWLRPIAYCENDPYCQSVLLSRMRDGNLPRAGIWDDVCTLSGAELENGTMAFPDIIYGGFPCQDISLAGHGIGLDGKRSNLVFQLLRLCEETRPTFIFLENVPAIRTRGGERVGKELASLGYDCRWDIVSAREIGAPHRRERWFLLANANGKGLQITRNNEVETGEVAKAFPNSDPRLRDVAQGTIQSGRVPSELCFQKDFWEKTDSELLRMDDGLSPQTHRIRAMGNAVVPLQAREAFKRLMGLNGPLKTL